MHILRFRIQYDQWVRERFFRKLVQNPFGKLFVLLRQWHSMARNSGTNHSFRLKLNKFVVNKHCDDRITNYNCHFYYTYYREAEPRIFVTYVNCIFKLIILQHLMETKLLDALKYLATTKCWDKLNDFFQVIEIRDCTCIWFSKLVGSYYWAFWSAQNFIDSLKMMNLKTFDVFWSKSEVLYLCLSIVCLSVNIFDNSFLGSFFRDINFLR